MRCPYCGEDNDKVIDSRPGKGGSAIRRRRECLDCTRRFTTYETVEVAPLVLIKKDGSREEFAKEKIRAGMMRACEKRNISVHDIDGFIDQLEQELRDLGEKEVPSAMVGEKAIEKLRELDEVAYVRFASVYREFKDVNDFVSELKTLLDKGKTS